MDDQQKDQEVFRQNLNEKGSFQTLFQIYPKRHTPRREGGSKSITIQIRKGGYRSQREGFPLHFCYLEIHRGIQG